MKTAKSLAILIAVGAVLIFLSASFTSNDISSRAIVLGLGIDYSESTYTVTAEVLSPGGGQDQQVGTFSKVIQASGDTVPRALSNMYAETGRQISLGQCQLLILGQGLYTSDMVGDVLPYFTMSDEYKDSSSLCCSVGDASSLMMTQLPLSKSISFTLTELLKQSSIYASVPNITLSRFAQSGIALSYNSMCPLVQYVEQPVVDDDSASLEGIYDCFEMVLFDNFNYVSTVDKYNSIGYTLLDDRIVGQVYSVYNDNPDSLASGLVGVYVTDKQVDISANSEGDISIELNISLQEMSDTDIDNGGTLHPQLSTNLTDSMLYSVQQQIIAQADCFLQLSRQLDVDIIGLFKCLELRHGVSWVEDNYDTPIADMNIVLTVTVVED